MFFCWNTTFTPTHMWSSNSSIKCTSRYSLRVYRRTVTVPMLDHILSEISLRFSSHQNTALLGLYQIPLLLVTKTLEEVTETLKPLERMYSGDLNDSNFVSELYQWYVKWKTPMESMLFLPAYFIPYLTCLLCQHWHSPALTLHLASDILFI